MIITIFFQARAPKPPTVPGGRHQLIGRMRKLVVWTWVTGRSGMNIGIWRDCTTLRRARKRAFHCLEMYGAWNYEVQVLGDCSPKISWTHVTKFWAIRIVNFFLVIRIINNDNEAVFLYKHTCLHEYLCKYLEDVLHMIMVGNVARDSMKNVFVYLLDLPIHPPHSNVFWPGHLDQNVFKLMFHTKHCACLPAWPG